MPRFDPELRRRLLRFAHAALTAELCGDAPPDPRTEEWPPLPRSGVFVTLRLAGALRGCIGTFDDVEPLLETLQRLTVAAAHDPRFEDRPISAREVGEMTLELSILSQRERLADPLAFELGTHGIYVRSGNRTGCFLPQVAVEHGWDKETFLSRCCEGKAGLSADAWKKGQAEVCVFTVEKIADGAD